MSKAKTVTQVWRVQAMGDQLFIQAATKPEAEKILLKRMGHIPTSLLSWSGPMPLPEGEEALR